MDSNNILDFYSIGNYDFRVIVESNNKTNTYACYQNEFGGWCSCLGFRFRAKCTHYKMFIEYLVNNAKQKELKMTTILETSIKGLNSVLQGGIPSNVLVGFYGEPKSAKTTTSAWVAMDLMDHNGANFLYIDTESGIAENFLPDLVDRYNKRFKSSIGIRTRKLDFKTWISKPTYNLPYKDEKVIKEGEFYFDVVELPNLYQLMLFLGRPSSINLSIGKPSLKYKKECNSMYEYIWNAPFAELMGNSVQEFCGILLDSFTNVFKIFGSENQNYPVRDTAQSIVLAQLGEYVATHDDFFGIVIQHASKPPADQAKRAIPVGGKSVGHAFKYFVQFTDTKTEGLNTKVTISTYRLPTNLGSSTSQTVTVNNQGVI